MKLFARVFVVSSSGVLLLACGVATAAELGRLFFSPSERAVLDQARQNLGVEQVVEKPPEPMPVIEPIAVDEPAETPPPITVNGYVRRSKGRTTVWINGVDNQQGDLAAENIDAASVTMNKGQVHLDRSHGEGALTLKPGQTFDPATNEVVEAYRPLTFDDAP